ncbi:MAG: hypothetical protein Q7U57_17740 [Methylovulum sp.]|nr:hypothetical protein [Methylovulum sp.]
MSEQTIYSLSAACFGFVSALFFGIGSAFLSQSKTVALSGTYWGFNSALAASVVSQSAQYAIGALLLVVSFVLQVLVVPASQANHQWQCPVLVSAWLFVPSLLATIGLPSWLACKYLTKWRLARVLKQLKNKKSS